jgi:hypothetical protein
MSAADPSDARPLPPEETATASRGTGAPVDVSVDTGAVTSIAVLLAGPVISSVHFLLVYLIVEAGCTGDGAGLDWFDPPVPTVVTLVATAVAGIACAATAWWGFHRWRRRQVDGDGKRGDERVDREPLAFAGFLLSLLGLTIVLFVGLPALSLPACT